MSETLLWFNFRAGEQEEPPWRVYLSSTSPLHEGRPVLGLTDYGAARITIDAKQTRRDQDETLLHELMHVASAVSARVTGKDGPPLELEELIVHHVSPSLVRLLKMHNWKPPRRPAGVAALEKAARARSN